MKQKNLLSQILAFFSLMFAFHVNLLDAKSFDVFAWRGETVVAEVPDFCEFGEIPKDVTIKFGHLKSVRYAPYAGSLERREKFDRVVWGTQGHGEPRVVEISVPVAAKPGIYECGAMKLTVLDRELPEPRKWKYYLDLWQHPWAIARIAKTTPFSREHYAAMRPIYELLASAGQKAITIPILDLPWDHQCRDAYYSIVADADFKLFDEYVEFCLECGLGPDISCYSLCPWKLKVEPGSPEFEEYWAPFLTHFAAHLKEKGWFEHTYMAMDERAPHQVAAVVRFVEHYAPGMKISMAGDRNPADFKDIELANYSQVFQHIDDNFLAESANRRARGLLTTLYTCTNPARPNTFIGSDLYEAFWIGASPAVLGLDGYLRWAFCSWPEDPVSDASFGNWPAGDTFLAYPNGEPSIRFLELRNGIIAAEKVRILREADALDVTAERELRSLFNVEKALNGEYYARGVKEAVNRIVNNPR